MFSCSMVEQFNKWYKDGPQNHLRKGQAFWNFFNLQKCSNLPQDLQTLYEADGIKADNIINAHKDQMQ